MPIIKSAKKRVHVARKASIRNSKTKRALKGSIKSLSAKPSASTHSDAQSKIDRALKKGLIHKNKAARMKKRAAAKAKAANAKPASKTVAKAKTTTTKKPAAKTAAKKTTPKRTTKKS